MPSLWLPKRLLLALGLMDLVRGFMHTFAVRWAATNVAKAIPICPGTAEAASDTADGTFLLLMGAFGMGNFQTGFIDILISTYAPQLAPHCLVLIPLAYGLGMVAMKLPHNHVTAGAEYNGRYMMYVYLSLCVAVGGHYFLKKRMEAQAGRKGKSERERLAEETGEGEAGEAVSDSDGSE